MREVIDELRREIRAVSDRVRQAAANIVWMADLTQTSADGTGDKIRGESDEQQHDRQLRRFETWGFRGRPVRGVLGLMLRVVGGRTQEALAGIATTSYGPTDLEEGESCQYCRADGTRVRMTKDGDVLIDAAGARNVIINGGASGVGADEVVTKRDLQILYAAINVATTMPGDGGASLKSAILTVLGAAGWSSNTIDGHFGASRVKASRG
jgi:phage gp45-like